MSEQAVFDTLKYRTEVDEIGTRCYRNNAGKLHREDGPAVVFIDGYMEWWQNGQLHRIDGPAVEWANGTKEWYQDDLRHCTDGPAIIWANGKMEWWINGVRLTEAEFNQAVKY